MSLLRELHRLGALRPLDDALANTLRRLEPATPDAVLAAAALASLAVSQGHAGFDPARPRRVVDADLPWPAVDAWVAQLIASPLVATPDAPDAPAAAAPLVFERLADGESLLYLRRYREYERRLAQRLRQLASDVPCGPADDDLASARHSRAGGDRSPTTAPCVAQRDASPPGDEGPGAIAHLAPLFARLFPDAAAGDAQARAAALALRRALLLVTGGPGTGKTTTIARLLALRVAQAMQAGHAPPRIALAAPTGRAADRMAESLRAAVQRMAALAVDAAVLAALPATASTLHRLLGVLPDRPDFRHHAGHPLPFDIVVVDEASMVDLPLMCKLAEAVPDGAQLLLLGDPDQLPSVEAGDVLAGILRAAGDGTALRADDAAALAPLLGEPPPSTAEDTPQATLPLFPAPSATPALHGHRVHLTRGWRQSDTLALAPLADAVRRGDAAETLALLRGGGLSNVHFNDAAADPLAAPGVDLLAHFRALAATTDPAEALARAPRLRLLTALRNGPQGARGLNARIEAQLSGRRIGSPPAWFPGRLLLVTENSYRHGLFNGDVGVCLPDADGTLLAWFPGADGPRAFHPAALPAHESAFAMTVHKAQGSEFDDVWLQLPRRDARVLSRELLYTGLTRARTALHLAGSAEVIAAALARHAGRVSGLGGRLG
ncbi:exodeoxyribonuclease V subunit alpha [Thermomonas sp.]|uniref:exodeoxyribonuclease V subunit alpha n=1 Tax=Thermomonas sp. TaxID=1971895 RepID=UPI002F1633C8